MAQTQLFIARGVYRDGGLKGRTCSASVYSQRGNVVAAMADAEQQLPWMRVQRVERYSAETYGGTPVSVLTRAFDEQQAAANGDRS